VRIEVGRGDITRERVDAIVNAANSSLLGGGGVDGAIHAAAGPALLQECRRLRDSTHPDGLATGDAVATTGGDLPAPWVIHTVGPRHWEHHDGGGALLASCHRRCLAVADGLGLRSVSFPAISCGGFGWSPQQAAPIAVGAVREYAQEHPASTVALVRFVLFDEEAEAAFAAACSAVE
jgi:O-acetyl-ADP-ribose deacetylase (regulator of RNase III)